MRSTSFRPHPAAEQELRLGKPARRINWEKAIYLSLLGVLLLVISRYLVVDLLFVEAEGQIVSGTFDVRFPQDIRLVRVDARPNAEVREGAPLFSYVLASELQPPPSADPETVARFRRTELDLREAIELRRLDRQKADELLSVYREQESRLRRGIYLGVSTAGELERYTGRIAELERDRAAAERELALLEERLGLLAEEEAAYQASLAPRQTVHHYAAPVAGVVSSVFRQDAETVLSSERVLSIALKDSSKLEIRALLRKEDLAFIREGETVTVRHASGEKSRGRIGQLHLLDAASTANEVTMSLMSPYAVAQIVPLTAEDRASWQRLRNIAVTVTSWKF